MPTTYSWYQQLKKPKFAPPSYLFGPVWSVLYLLIFFSFGKVFLMYYYKEISFLILLPFLLNLFFNFLFTPLQFKVKSNILAAIDIILVFGTLVWAMVGIYSYLPWITYIQIPYLLWVSFASVLQLSVTYLNWGRGPKGKIS